MNIEYFTEPQDEEQLQQLEEATETIPLKDFSKQEFQELLQIFERATYA
jgi:hypothetical protein